MKATLFLSLIFFTSLFASQADEERVENWKGKNVPPAPSLTPEEALKTFKLAPGFDIELVASEPALDNPIAMSWDGNGRLWVVQMTAYMPTVLGEGEEAKTGKITVLEDTNNDGKMDKHTVFLGGLLRPRALAHVKGGVLVSEPPTLWFCEDTNGDLKCDKKTKVGDYAKAGPPEHTDNGLMYALDNWMYNAKSNVRHKFVDGKLITSPTKSRGQWGISQDNYGRLYYTSNSAYRYTDWETYFQPLKTSTDDNSINSIRMNYGINRGYQKAMLKADGRLARVTAISGPGIYRDNLYGDSYENGYFVPEPAANALSYFEYHEEKNELKFKHQMYDDAKWGKREFLTSTDERFRPVSVYTGPDGCIYIVDLYHGILQHLKYVTQDYLGKQVLERGLDKGNLKGRIYRIVPKKSNASHIKPNMLNENAVDLVKHLSNKNGWWRDTAQRLLVQHNDKSVIPLLENIVKTSSNHLAKIHAMWTLEGMGEKNASLLESTKKDTHPKVALTAQLLSVPFPVKDYTNYKSNYKKLNNEGKSLFKIGQKVYSQTCFGCHQTNGKGLAQLAPTLAGSNWMKKSNETLIKIVLHGIAGPITVNKKLYKTLPVMPGHGPLLDDKKVAGVITFIRNYWGNKGKVVIANEVKDVRKETAGRTGTWTEQELLK